MKRRTPCLLACALLLGACAPQLRFSSSAEASFEEQGYTNARAQVGFWAWDVLRLKGGKTTDYRFLDSDGVGGWIGGVNLTLKGASSTNRFLVFQKTYGQPPMPFKRYTWDLHPGSNGIIRED